MAEKLCNVVLTLQYFELEGFMLYIVHLVQLSNVLSII